MKKTKAVTIPLEEATYNQLQQTAEAEERTLTDTARRLLRKGLNKALQEHNFLNALWNGDGNREEPIEATAESDTESEEEE